MGFGRLLLHRYGGLALLLAGATVLFAARLHVAGLPWTDEEFTILLVESEPKRLVELAANDAHPPGYYLLQKLWLKPFRMAGIEPDATIGRLHGLAWRCLALTIVWFAGRRAFGAGPAAACAWLLALSPRILEGSTEMRQYSIVAPTMPVLLALMWGLDAMDREVPRRRAAIAGGWTLYGVLAIACLWCHYAAAFSLLALGLLWIGLCAYRGRGAWRSGFFLGGFAAQGAAVLSFVPWIRNIASNVSHVRRVNIELWNTMTPATFRNLAKVGGGWMPFGQEYDLLPSPWPRVVVLAGLAGSAVPVGVWFLARLRGRRSDAEGRKLETAGLAALAMGAGVVGTFWLMARLGQPLLFMGSRYPIVALGFWMCGLALLSFATARTFGRDRSAVLMLIPWIAVSGAGLARVFTHGFNEWKLCHLYDPIRWNRTLLPPPGEPFYVMPPELVPYLRDEYSDWEVRRIDELPRHPPGKDAVVFRFSRLWSKANNSREIDLAWAIEHRRLSADFEMFQFDGCDWYLLKGLRPEVLARFGKADWSDFRRASIGRAASEARVESQEPHDGWYELEWEGEDRPVRRTIASPAIARFDRSLSPGEYVLRVAGYQMPYPSDKVEFRVRVIDEPGAVVREVSGWDFELEVPVVLTKYHAMPAVAIERPVWMPAEHIKGSQDLRPFGFTLLRMWFEKPTP